MARHNDDWNAGFLAGFNHAMQHVIQDYVVMLNKATDARIEALRKAMHADRLNVDAMIAEHSITIVDTPNE